MKERRKRGNNEGKKGKGDGGSKATEKGVVIPELSRLYPFLLRLP